MLGFGEKADQGAGYYSAPNPEFGAVFSYHLADGYMTHKEQRQEREKPLIAKAEDVPFPGLDAIEAEARQAQPAILLTVSDSAGNVVRRLEGPATEGFHRMAWDLRFPPTAAIGAQAGFGGEPQGHMVLPGDYTVELAKRIDGELTPLAGPRSFAVKRINQGALQGAELEDTVAFWQQLAALQRSTTAAGQVITEARVTIDNMRTALQRSLVDGGELDAELHALDQQLYSIAEQFQGKAELQPIGEPQPHTIGTRIFVASMGTMLSSYGPTPTHRRSLEIAETEFADVRAQLNQLIEQRLPALQQRLLAAGAPWLPGSPVPNTGE